MRITQPSRRSISISLCAALGLVFAMTVIANANFITDGTSNTFLDGSVKFRGFESMLAVSDNGHRIFVTGKVNCGRAAVEKTKGGIDTSIPPFDGLSTVCLLVTSVTVSVSVLKTLSEVLLIQTSVT